MLGYHTVPVSGSSSDMNALSRLLTIQDAIIMTQRLIFAARNDNVQVPLSPTRHFPSTTNRHRRGSLLSPLLRLSVAQVPVTLL